MFERVTHALYIERIESDQVARQLRATIVQRDNSGLESALFSFSFFPCVFHTNTHTCTHTLYMYILFDPPPPPPSGLGLGGNKEMLLIRRTENRKLIITGR